jgi:hypothetical protein
VFGVWSVRWPRRSLFTVEISGFSHFFGFELGTAPVQSLPNIGISRELPGCGCGHGNCQNPAGESLFYSLSLWNSLMLPIKRVIAQEGVASLPIQERKAENEECL